MSTVKFNTWQNTDGTENYKCRAWVNFNGTGTVAIRASGNVSSITDNGTGDYTLNYTTSIPDANYSALMTGTNRNNASTVGYTSGYYSTDDINAAAYTTTALRVSNKSTAGSTNIDIANVSVAVFR